MRFAVAFRAVTSLFRTGLPALALLCAAILSFLTLASCGGDSCLTFTWNFPGPISTGNKSCGINQATGNVSVRLTSTAPSTAGPMAPNLLHIFVSLQGIEAHPEATTDENSPAWEELAPDLVKEPVQIDLMAPAANFCVTNSIGHALVAAGPYRQIRLRLVPNHAGPDVAIPQNNVCGEIGVHCVITANRETRPLIFDESALGLHIAPNRIAGGFFQVLPNTDTILAVEFNPYSSLAVPSGESVRIVPIFTVDSVASCDSLQASQR